MIYRKYERKVFERGVQICSEAAADCTEVHLVRFGIGCVISGYNTKICFFVYRNGSDTYTACERHWSLAIRVVISMKQITQSIPEVTTFRFPDIRL